MNTIITSYENLMKAVEQTAQATIALEVARREEAEARQAFNDLIGSSNTSGFVLNNSLMHLLGGVDREKPFTKVGGGRMMYLTGMKDPGKKIDLIRAIRDVCDVTLGLKGAKDIVDCAGVASRFNLIPYVDYEVARKAIEEAGGSLYICSPPTISSR